MSPREIGAAIRRQRLRRGWSLVELARRAGTSAPTVHRYESGWSRFEVRTLEKLNKPEYAPLLEQARANAIYHMGMLSHFVGDFAQPLHTTKHFNGWVGENPNGYTTSNRFHSYIDGGVIREHAIGYEDIRSIASFDRKVNPRDPWTDVVAYVRGTFETVELLYQMEKDGRLRQEEGKEFIERRLAAGASMLSALYWAAYSSAAPTEKDVADFVFFDERGAVYVFDEPPVPESPPNPCTGCPSEGGPGTPSAA